jgi:hypothetical protein
VRLALAAVLVVLAAGCGGGGSNEQPLGGGAVFLPAGIVSFLAARTDADWRPLVRTVLHRDPPRIPKDTVEVDIAVLQGGTTVVLTKPKHGDWRGAAASPPTPSLADNANYLAATRAAPPDATARAYVRGDVAGERFAAIPGQIAVVNDLFRTRVRVREHLRTANLDLAELRWRWLSAWATKEGYGARLHSSGRPVGPARVVRFVQRLVPAYPPAVFDEIPADAQYVVDATLAPGTFSYLDSVPRRLRTLFPGVDGAGLDLILGGETVLYTRPGGETTVVSSPADVQAALDRLKSLPALHTATLGGQLVLSTTQQGIAAFRADGPKLAAKLDIPARVAGVAYERGKTVGWASRDGDDPTFTVRFVGTGS